MTKTFEQAIAEAQKQFTENCQAIVEQYRKYPDGFTFTLKGSTLSGLNEPEYIVRSATLGLYGDSAHSEIYDSAINYEVECLNRTFQDLTKKGKRGEPHPLTSQITEQELDTFLKPQGG